MIKALRTSRFLRPNWHPKMLILLAVAAPLALHGLAPRADELSDEELVREHYPSDLLGEIGQIAGSGGPAHRGQALVRGSFPGGTGGDVVAAYTNGFGGAVRILRRDGQQVQIFDSPRFAPMGGSDCGVSLVDLEADGVPEIAASFGAPAGGHLTWLFRWTSTGLVFLGPSASNENGAVTSVLHEVTFRDFDGDGTLEAVDADQDDQGNQLVRVFKLTNGIFTLWKQPLFYAEYSRDGLRSTIVDATVQGPAGTRTLSIMNGLPGRADTRLRSAVVAWNGAILVPATDFGTDVGALQVPVPLSGGADTLQVELRGSLDGHMAILIE
jgi:hypothetical protein